jgi:hypothetical protein
VREIRGAKINPKSSFKNQGAQITLANTVCLHNLRKSNGLTQMTFATGVSGFCV